MDIADRIAVFARARELNRPIDDRLRGIYAKKVAWAARQTTHQEKLRCVYTVLRDDRRANDAWIRLLNHLGYNTPLLAVDPVLPSLGPQPGNTSLDALMMLVLRHDQWIGHVENWLPESDGAAEQLASLARHLLTRYYVPPFLNAGWFEGFTSPGRMHQDWFVHIGTGKNIRRAELPVRLTEKAAHYFMQAPRDATIVGALRYGQVLALGGDAYLAQAIAESKLGSILPDEEFWASVLHFFVNHQELNLSDVGPIVDYLYTQRFGEGEPPPEGTIIDLDAAPDPGLTMKGRTLQALLRRVEEWHEKLARSSKRPRTSWQPSGIAPFRTDQPDRFKVAHSWLVRELLSSQELMEEGREQKHCVFGYGANCVNGSCSIWSLRVRAGNDVRFRRLLTIEVNNGRRAVVQVRGRCNKTLGASRRSERMRTAGEILRRWARESRLSIACGL
jgi:hypothetical protein